MANQFGVTLLLIYCAWCSVVQASGSGWNYNDSSSLGPSHWPVHYNICGYEAQSPINIVTGSAASITLPDLTLTGYDAAVSQSFTLTNNGHSAQVSVNTKTIKISGFGLGARYVLEQFHFHWGSTAETGSEHTVDGKHYPAEVHLVHYNSDKYNNVTEASSNTSDSTALAVLGVMIDVTSDTKKVATQLDTLISKVADVPHEGDAVTVESFALHDVLPCDYSMYRYNGSLTTPGCAEVVIWTVFSTPIYITSTQLAKFRDMNSNPSSEHDEKLTYNYRPTQSLNSRTVHKYTDETATVRCDGPRLTGSLMTLLVAALFVCSGIRLS